MLLAQDGKESGDITDRNRRLLNMHSSIRLLQTEA